MEHPFHFIALSLFLAFLISLVIQWKRSKASQKRLPPSPWKLPFIGHLHYLAAAPPHHALTKLSHKFGALIHIQLGEIPTILVSSPRLAKEIFKTHDLAMADRGELLAGRIFGYNYTTIALAPYGEYWRQMRKICTLELFSAKRVRSFASIREDEGFKLVRSIKPLVGTAQTINLTDKLAQYTSSMVCRAAFGEVNEDDRKSFLVLIKEGLQLTSAFDFSDLFPSLKILHPFLSVKSEMMRTQRNQDRVLDKIINQHIDKLARSTTSSGESSNEDLIDVLLRVKESSELQVPITKDNIKVVLLDVFTAGTETSSSTVEWAMAEMIRHPEVMEKVQSEIRTAFREKETIEEDKIQELRYLKAVVKETLRLHPPVPLLIPRESREQREIDGYIIPVKTRVIVNAWAMGRDPEYWVDPESFKPERFENIATDFNGCHFEYIPFGAGRRICPGMSFGLANVYLPLAVLLYHFDWEIPDGLNPKDLDMAETVGITACRTKPLLLLAKSYHPSLQMLKK